MFLEISPRTVTSAISLWRRMVSDTYVHKHALLASEHEAVSELGS